VKTMVREVVIGTLEYSDRFICNIFSRTCNWLANSDFGAGMPRVRGLRPDAVTRRRCLEMFYRTSIDTRWITGFSGHGAYVRTLTPLAYGVGTETG
jgi:hypothetical protein